MANAVMRKSPLAEVRWFKMLTPQPGLDDNGDLFYSTELILDANQPATIEFLELLDGIVEDLIGNDRKSQHCYPYAEMDGGDQGKIKVRFKCKQLKRDDGQVMPGPVVVDSKKNPWPQGEEVGNGSKCVVAFKPIKWKQKTGSGISLIPTAVMVVEHVAFSRENPLDLLDEQEGVVVSEALAAF